MDTIKKQIKKIPILGSLATQLYRLIKGVHTKPKQVPTSEKPKPFPGSEKYWEERYASGGNSGVGSYDKFAAFKAEIINSFVANNNVTTVIEFGCGDGSQLELANYQRYLGYDVSETVISLCKKKYVSDTSKSFKLTQEYEHEIADLSLSLDVIYHLIEDEVFENYIREVFNAASRYVMIYSSDSDDNEGYEGTHVKHRKFSKWIEENIPGWRIKEHIPNRYPYTGDYEKGSFADFYIYEKA